MNDSKTCKLIAFNGIFKCDQCGHTWHVRLPYALNLPRSLDKAGPIVCPECEPEKQQG